MHDLEPYFKWRDHYNSARDKRSPFYGRQYSEFEYSQKIYNYYIHPQWDGFGSATLYTKIIYADYSQGFAVLEFIGEWNDCIQNDIMFLKTKVIDPLINEGISKFALICENILNFHASDDCYYEEWFEEIAEELGWVCMINVRQHIEEEMQTEGIDRYLVFSPLLEEFNWRRYKPQKLCAKLQEVVDAKYKLLH